MVRRAGIGVADFERALDEFFDEMLISRWRRSADPDRFENAQILDLDDRYEVRIAMPNVDPHRVEVEVSGQRLSVRAPVGPEGTLESAYSFASPIESDAVEARWSEQRLLVIVPKQKPKRIKVND